MFTVPAGQGKEREGSAVQRRRRAHTVVHTTAAWSAEAMMPWRFTNERWRAGWGDRSPLLGIDKKEVGRKFP